MSTMTLKDRFFDPNFIHLNIHKVTVSHSQSFAAEFERMERQRPSSNNLSQLYDHNSRLSLFLDRILVRGHTLPQLELAFPELLRDGLQSSPDVLSHVSSEWQSFAEEFFISRGRPVPDWPQYVEIKEGLGIYGRTKYHRQGRKLKQAVQRRLKSVFHRLCELFPDWEYATKKHCYLTALFSDDYFLPSGDCSC
jgi:hypothetical protein